MAYIPDLTERFPEGMDGIDMTPSFYNEPIYREGYESSHEEDTELD